MLMTQDKAWEKSNDPGWMFPYIGKQSDRKLVLFAVACSNGDKYWKAWSEKHVRVGTTPEHAARYWCGINKYNGVSPIKTDPVSKAMTAERLRVMFGNPFLFRPVNYFLNLNTLGDGKVKRMAQTIYDTEDWGIMPILADLVAESGLEDVEIDKHLRQVVCQHCEGKDKWRRRAKLVTPTPIHLLVNENTEHPKFEVEAINDCLFCNGTGKPMRLRGDWCIDLLSGQE